MVTDHHRVCEGDSTDSWGNREEAVKSNGNEGRLLHGAFASMGGSLAVPTHL